MKFVKYLILIIIIGLPLVGLADNFDLFSFGSSWGLPSAEGEGSPAGIAVTVVNVVLSFLGLITLIIVLWGGFLYLFARGNVEQATKGRKVLFTGIIGILIVLAAYGISYFVFNQLSTVTGGEGSGYTPGQEEGFKCKQAGGTCTTCASEFRLGVYDCPSFTMCCRRSATGCVASGGHCEWGNCNEGETDLTKLDCSLGKTCCK